MHLSAPSQAALHRPDVESLWHLSYDQKGQSCDCLVFVRVPVPNELYISLYLVQHAHAFI